jgi:AraC-like DNA-binding protein
VIELKEFAHARTGKVDLRHQEIVLVVRGGMQVAVDEDQPRHKVGEWEFVFVPVGTTLSGMVEHDSAILIIRVTKEYPECNIFGMKISDPLEDKPDGIYPLKANESIKYCIEGLLKALGDGLTCRHYLQMKVGEILYLLHACYPLRERIRFLSSIITPDIEFSEFVRLNWVKHMSAKELADAMSMSEQQFSSRFRKVFGTTPRRWLQQQKAQRIYHDLCKSDKELKMIAAENKLTDTSLNRYCHKNFGSSPGAIREKLKVNSFEY